MLVILRDNIPNLGSVGDVVKVADGYARNYLLPRRLVVVANEGNVLEMQHHKRVLDKKRAKQREEFEAIAKKMGEFSCTVARKVGRNEKLFGSVTSADVAAALKKGGFEVDKGAVQLKEPLKTLGIHQVAVRLHQDVSATVKVWIVKDGSDSEEEKGAKGTKGAQAGKPSRNKKKPAKTASED